MGQMYKYCILVLCCQYVSGDLLEQLHAGTNDTTLIRRLFFQSPFCKSNCDCECSEVDKEPLCRVRCNRDGMKDALYNSGYFFADSVIMYHFTVLRIHGENWPKISGPFVETQLHLLDLSNNSVREIGADIFKNQMMLAQLILSHNKIDKIHSEAFKNFDGQFNHPMRNFMVLDLSYNMIRYLEKDVFENLNMLQQIDLSHNPVKVLGESTVSALHSCVSLWDLNLGYTQIASLPNDMFDEMTSMKNLDLSGNSFTGVPTALNRTTLNKVTLDDNPIRTLNASNGFLPSVNMTTVRICNMKHLTEIGAFAFGHLYQLEELHVCNNPALKHINQKALTVNNYTKVTDTLLQLHVENNGITTIEKGLIDDWDTLELFNISGNPWHCDCNLMYLITEIMPLTAKFRDAKKNLRYQKDNVRCSSPKKLRGTSVYTIIRNRIHLNCNPQLEEIAEEKVVESASNAGLWIGLTIGLFLVACTIAGIFYAFKYQASTSSFARLLVRYTRDADEESLG